MYNSILVIVCILTDVLDIHLQVHKKIVGDAGRYFFVVVILLM